MAGPAPRKALSQTWKESTPSPAPVRVKAGLRVSYGFTLGASDEPVLLLGFLCAGKVAVRQRLRAILGNTIVGYHDLRCR
jgi:hypothetical protein